MGSCLSKTKEVHAPLEKQGAIARSRPANGHSLGDGSNTQSSREAAAKAAELRYKNQQESLVQSKAKLKAMEKMSKLEKGLA
ncbi:hypothetical protein METSCH_C02010 [Metschnikowia aff. pulcherrima]|uniref:Uncharacterized protein n=1 Tax=Metschnikowia aff. pulcherrima TaxID=2163413 RepID=A0A4P6XPN6_9ASCO|nr:hypothetical protein METSCH_C02010 [Metschnikowia aff. pulcherrima]